MAEEWLLNIIGAADADDDDDVAIRTRLANALRDSDLDLAKIVTGCADGAASGFGVTRSPSHDRRPPHAGGRASRRRRRLH